MTDYEKLLLAARYSPTTIGNMILNPKGAYASADAIKLLERQIATLTRQRDLAVEALEKTRGALAYVKANGRDNPNLMESTAWHGLAAADKALATIKESEGKR